MNIVCVLTQIIFWTPTLPVDQVLKPTEMTARAQDLLHFKLLLSVNRDCEEWGLLPLGREGNDEKQGGLSWIQGTAIDMLPG